MKKRERKRVDICLLQVEAIAVIFHWVLNGFANSRQHQLLLCLFYARHFHICPVSPLIWMASGFMLYSILNGHTNLHLRTNIQMKHTHTHTYIYVCAYVFIYIYICMYIYIYIILASKIRREKADKQLYALIYVYKSLNAIIQKPFQGERERLLMNVRMREYECVYACVRKCLCRPCSLRFDKRIICL